MIDLADPHLIYIVAAYAAATGVSLALSVRVIMAGHALRAAHDRLRSETPDPGGTLAAGESDAAR